MTSDLDIFKSISAMFEAHGDELYGEDVTQRQHALQSAHFAAEAGEDEAMIVACLLHDIGHMLSKEDEEAARRGIDDRHEFVADPWLTQHFPPEVSEPAMLHVEAKRYLCAVNPTYLQDLSDASRLSLSLQGGPMSPEEIRKFEGHAFFDRAVRLRRFDDMGKDPQLEVPGLDAYEEMVKKLAK